MFSFLKKKKSPPNRVFGTVKQFDGYWSTSVKGSIVLWGKDYQLNCVVTVDDSHPEITPAQEDVYLRFAQNTDQIQKQIEHIVSDYFGTTDASVLLSKFLPYQLMVSPKGELAVIAKNADDGDWHDDPPGLAVVIFPRLSIFTKEDFSEYALRDGCDEVKAILYGGE